jgi:hypothetical protein
MTLMLLLASTLPLSLRAADDGMARHWLKLDQQSQADRLEAEQREYLRDRAPELTETQRMSLERSLRQERLRQHELSRRQEREQTGLLLRTRPADAPMQGPSNLQRQLFHQQQEQLRLHQDLQRRSRSFGGR